jgi:hypothetical protein
MTSEQMITMSDIMSWERQRPGGTFGNLVNSGVHWCLFTGMFSDGIKISDDFAMHCLIGWLQQWWSNRVASRGISACKSANANRLINVRSDDINMLCFLWEAYKEAWNLDFVYEAEGKRVSDLFDFEVEGMEDFRFVEDGTTTLHEALCEFLNERDLSVIVQDGKFVCQKRQEQ